MKNFIAAVAIAAGLFVCNIQASAKGKFLTTQFKEIQNKEQVFQPGGSWLPYPAYSDRDAWGKLAAPFLKQIVEAGDKYLGFEWELQRASSYLEYEKTGNRKLMLPEENNRAAFVRLVCAELAEGKGRYMKDIVDGAWFLCQQYSWAHGQHTRMQSSRRTLPTYEEGVISLHNSSTGAMLALAYHFLKDEFDKLDPSISASIKREVKRQIIDPYGDSSKDNLHWWFGYNPTRNHVVNNWNVFCNFNSILCILLLEDDQQTLINDIAKCCESVDIYIDKMKDDGACDEGPSYWGMACGTLYDLLRTLHDASGGKIDIFSEPKIKNMGEYKSKTFFGDGWVMNFSDGAARELGDVGILYRYGKDTGSRELMNFAMHLLCKPEANRFIAPSALPGTLTGGIYHLLETMRYHEALRDDETAVLKANGGDYAITKAALRSNIPSTSYPQTEYGIFRCGKWVLAAKGGNNNESHNHNDVGSGILVVDEIPLLVDPGVGEYRKDTFSDKRYTIWTMSSGWHNCPVVNGKFEMDGMEFRAKDTKIDVKANKMSMDIAGAFGEDAACKKWIRTYSLTDKSLTIGDNWELSKRIAANELHLIVNGKAEITGRNEVTVTASDFSGNRSKSFVFKCPKGYEISLVDQQFSDKRLAKCWKSGHLTMIRLKGADNAPAKGSSSILITEKL